MTRKELIDHLSHLEKYTHYSEDAPALREVIEMLTETREERTETHACDLIDRREAIDAVSTMFAPTPTQRDMVEDCLEIIENLPSAQPEVDCQKCIFCGFAGFKQFQTAQPEITLEDIKKYCEKRCLVILTSELYNEMKSRWSSAQPDIIRCKDCKHWEQESICDGYCSEIEKGGFDEDHFCSYAERWEDG